MADEPHCLFCARHAYEPILLPSQSGQVCRMCALQLGSLLLTEDARVAILWPALRHRLEEEEGPEPIVTLPDGRVVELRQRTAELKEQLSMDQRAVLAGTYVTIGMFREAVLEAALVLTHGGSTRAASMALEVLLQPPLATAKALPGVQALLRPH